MKNISLIGIILKRRYCIVEKVGHGANGQLYLARDLELGCVWAVKEIPLDNKKEAKLLRLLEHPSLPRMIDYAEREAFCYLVMEYVKGKSLGEWLRQGRVFSFGEIVELGIAAAQVLQYLHTRKPPVFHGDLKPDNFMLTEDGRLYLVDFGSAAYGYREQQRICSGTKGYAAPEQYEGRMGVSSDIYALGRTLLQLCEKKIWRIFLEWPMFGILLRKCCRKRERDRISDMGILEKKLKQVRDAERKRGRGYFGGFGLFLSVCLFLVGMSFLYEGERVTFEDAVSAVTGIYYEEQIWEENGEALRVVGIQIENRLRKLLKRYKAEEDQCRLLLLLAYNSEMMGEMERAFLYYEQLLLYQPDFESGYGEYGMFLLRQKEEEKNEALWETYQELAKAWECEEPERERNLILWKKHMEDVETVKGKTEKYVEKQKYEAENADS